MDTFTIICDWPDCGADVCDGSDYSGWGDVDYLDETMSDYGWWHGVNGEHYCNDHPGAWSSDAEQVASMDGPYLLIHDDDMDSADIGGKVSLIGGESC